MSTPPKKAPRKKSARPQKNREKNGEPEPDAAPAKVLSDEINPNTGTPFAQAFVDARFKPGQVANPGGRPKGRRTAKSYLQSILDETFVDENTGLPVDNPVTGDPMTKREALMRRLVDDSLRRHPDRQALEIVTSREIPKPTVIDATIETTDPKVREAVSALDKMGREALRSVLGQLGAKSPLDDDPASPDDPIH